MVFHTNRAADVDNLVKSVHDALNGIAWEDDRQVKAVLAEKRPCQRGRERTEIAVMSLLDYEALAPDVDGILTAARAG